MNNLPAASPDDTGQDDDTERIKNENAKTVESLVSELAEYRPNTPKKGPIIQHYISEDKTEFNGMDFVDIDQIIIRGHREQLSTRDISIYREPVLKLQVSMRKALFYLTLGCATLALSRDYLHRNLNVMVTRTDIASDFYLQRKIKQLDEYEQGEDSPPKLFLIADILERVKNLAETHNTLKAVVLAAATDANFKNNAIADICDALDELHDSSQQTSSVLQQEPAFKVIRLVESCRRELGLTKDEAKFSEKDKEELLLKDVGKYYPDIGLMAGSLAMLFATVDAEDSEGLERAVREKLAELNITLDENIIASLIPELTTQILVNRQNDAAKASTDDVASR